MSHFLTFAVLVGLLTTTACKRDEKFPSIDNRLVTPTDVAADSTGNFFFVLSSDDSRDYNVGSIVVFSKEGDKVGVVLTPRLGRTLTVAGSDMLVTYSYAGEDSPSKAELYDVSDPTAIKLTASWLLGDCNPINAVMRANYQYFAVSCSSGAIFIGELATPRSASKINLVRRYPGARRALHLDTSRNLLIAFTSDLRSQYLLDTEMVDVSSYTDDNEGTITATPNEIPDVWETTRADRRNKSRRGIYQYVVYDIAAEAAKQFPQVDDYTTVLSELRWTYFKLANFDGSPDIALDATQASKRYYRTNFWDAQPDPTDSDAFFLSHRGTSDTSRAGSPHANSIIRVRITGDLRPAGTTAPFTEDVLMFERVYGFKGELEPSGKSFPGAFEVSMVNGAPLLVVNHFRDIKNFPASRYSSLASKVIGENGWFSEITESATGHSYSNIAVTPSGRAMAISFYQNLAILLDATPGAAITVIKTTN